MHFVHNNMANDDEQPNQGHPTVEDTMEEEEEQEEALGIIHLKSFHGILGKRVKERSNSQGEATPLLNTSIVLRLLLLPPMII